MEKIHTNLRTTGIINLILGAWLVASPYLLGYAATQSSWNQAIAGVVIGGLGLWRVLDPAARWARWVAVVAGIWLIAAPYILSYSVSVAYWNELFAALIVGVLAIDVATTTEERPGSTRRRTVL